MIWLALKTMHHEKVRLVITLTGIIFSTVLTIVQVSMYLGMMGNATSIIRNTDADIWIASRNVQNFDFAYPFSEEKLNRVRAYRDVQYAERLIMTWGFLKLADGGQDQVQIIGFNPDTGIGAPWSMISGRPEDVKGGRYMIMDKTSEKRLGELRTGSLWELGGRKFKLVGLSDGIKSFTTAPIIFTSYEQAQMFQGFIKAGQTSYIVAKVRDKEKIGEIVKDLKATMRDNDIYTKNDFGFKTVMYWTIQTGIGLGYFLTASLGLIVGGAIVGQTIYANTMEHLREYGTLKALGARNSDIYQVIFSQVGISAVIGFAVGSGIILALRGGVEKAGVSLYLSPGLFLVMFFIVLSTCFLSAYFSVKKIRTLDPMTVFRA